MNIQELRIGNAIQNLEGETYSVIGIGYDEYGYPTITTDEFETISQDPSQVKPIPITEERLLRFGFKKESSKYPIPYGSVDFILEGVMSVGLFKDKFTVFIEDEINGCNVDIELKSVHQFQNLYFALKNTELVCQ